MIVKLILTCLLCLSAIAGDIAVGKLEKSQLLKALVDNGTHAIIGGLTWTIVCIHLKFQLSKELFWQILICFGLSSFIDIDHFIAAKSFNLKDIHLNYRPFLHNSSLAVCVSFAAVAIAYARSSQILHTLGWILFAAFASHHTRDATRRGYWFPPFGSTAPIFYWAYISATLLLPYIIAYFYSTWKPKDHIYLNTLNIDKYTTLV